MNVINGYLMPLFNTVSYETIDNWNKRKYLSLSYFILFLPEFGFVCYLYRNPEFLLFAFASLAHPAIFNLSELFCCKYLLNTSMLSHFSHA